MRFLTFFKNKSYFCGRKSCSQITCDRGRSETPLTNYRFNPSDFQPTLKTRLLILQPTPFCNINCDYCYLPDRDFKTIMSLNIVRSAAERLLADELLSETLTVVWHAGEPLVIPP